MLQAEESREGMRIPLLPPGREQQMLGCSWGCRDPEEGAVPSLRSPGTTAIPDVTAGNGHPRVGAVGNRQQRPPFRPGSGLKVRERQLAGFPHGPGPCT